MSAVDSVPRPRPRRRPLESSPLRILHLAPQADDESGVAAYAVRFRRAVAAQPGLAIAPLDRPPATPDSIADLRRYAAAARAAAPGFDVVHAEVGGSALREFHAARAVARHGGPPVVLTAHDPPRLDWRPFHTAGVREHRTLRALAAVLGDRPARRMERDLARRAAAILTLSELGTARAAAGLGGPARYDVLPYPCEPAPLVDRPSTPPGAPLTLGFHGYWYGGKGIDVLLQALARVRQDPDRPVVRLRLWGAPPAGGGERAGARYHAGVLAAVERWGLADRVQVAGRLPAAEAAARLGECDAIVLPYEVRRTAAGLASISSVVFDALAAGTPVVASDVRAIGETLQPGVDGLTVPPGDVLALGAAVRRLRDEPALRDRLRRGAVAHGRRLGLTATGRHAASVYRAVTAGGG